MEGYTQQERASVCTHPVVVHSDEKCESRDPPVASAISANHFGSKLYFRLVHPIFVDIDVHVQLFPHKLPYLPDVISRAIHVFYTFQARRRGATIGTDLRRDAALHLPAARVADKKHCGDDVIRLLFALSKIILMVVGL